MQLSYCNTCGLASSRPFTAQSAQARRICRPHILRLKCNGTIASKFSCRSCSCSSSLKDTKDPCSPSCSGIISNLMSIQNSMGHRSMDESVFSPNADYSFLCSYAGTLEGVKDLWYEQSEKMRKISTWRRMLYGNTYMLEMTVVQSENIKRSDSVKGS